MTAIFRSRSWARRAPPGPLRRRRRADGVRAVARGDVADERIDQPLLIARPELRAHDLLGQGDGGGSDLAAQVFLRLLDLLLDDERGLVLDAARPLLGRRNQPRLLRLRLLLDPGGDAGDLLLQGGEPLLLLLEARLGRGARLGGRREIRLDLAGARVERLRTGGPPNLTSRNTSTAKFST